jgi:acyl-CoA reductase-like NAD-dependent aldehyde dehydrogenase
MSSDEARNVDTTGSATRLRGAPARITPRHAVEAAEQAFPRWSAMAPSERGGLLQRASELLMERQAAIAALVTEETNGTLGWGMFNVQLGAGMLDYYANQSDAIAEEQEIPSPAYALSRRRWRTATRSC